MTTCDVCESPTVPADYLCTLTDYVVNDKSGNLLWVAFENHGIPPDDYEIGSGAPGRYCPECHSFREEISEEVTE